MQAGHVLEDGAEAMFLARDFTADALMASRCAEPLRFEQLGPAGGGRLVDFEWQPETSELKFDVGAANPGVTLPERFVIAASLASSPGCE